MNKRPCAALLASVAVSALLPAAQVYAQSAPVATTRGEDDIIVTARKREENAIAVPVVITAVSGGELNRRGISNLDGIARLVPSLNIAEGGGTVQGGTITLRGIAGPDTNPLGDQAVSFNIDSVQVAKASVRRLGNFDIAQVEVLKGPQTLFFGKNSPGGVISMRTADPTASLSAKLSVGYEVNAHEWRTEGYIAGPVTDTLGARIAFYTSDMRGWVKNLSFQTQGNILSPNREYGPKNHEWGVRGTLLFEPSDRFSAKLKFTYGRGRGADSSYNFQYIHCPYGGVPQFVGVNDECRANNKVSHANIGPNFTQFEPAFGDGTPYARVNQQLGGLELNYDLTDQLRLTSVTGYYRINYLTSSHFTTGIATQEVNYGLGLPMLPSLITYYDREITEELRLQSDFDGPINFTLGGLYQDTLATTGAHTFANPVTPIEFNEYLFKQKGKAYSFFGQLNWDILPTLELSGGGRYSHEEKRLPLLIADVTGNPTVSPGTVIPVNPGKVSFNDFSPEVTLSYRPTNDLTIFGSYKRGFLSGGYNGSSADVSLPINYGPQKVRGFEAGLKAALFDRALRVNFAAYSYDILGLQITSFAGTVGTIRNAGKVSVKGAEFDFNYRTPIDGFTLRGAIAYNRGRYDEYLAPCYTGQTPALGCDMVNSGGAPVQDLGGTTLRNAPKLSGSLGMGYEAPIGSDLKLGFSTDLNYTSSEITDAKSTPHAVSPRRALLDATLRIGAQDDRWELALIGRNLTDQHYWATSQGVPLTGNFTAGNPLEDQFAVISRGREVMIRATYKFGS
ncbi:TonB-dependent receptor [Sphingobium sp. 3R8]|uniref:TonB-dependent receptor n=1 Tax=Sphingobium sp. 3R8 TaxID=2874921 RepID=UPI001CC9D250|nr:TonB-dependent receptor [Sphingobium sp. 3R8]MBZ9649894.1 TonB-dependent receptor [Sphingobium sp. 3R8]